MRIRKGETEDIIFRTINRYTVSRLKHKQLNVPKDMQWNERTMQSRLLRGLLNGDSITEISKSLLSIVKNNEASAIRNARTMTTNAECSGRMDSYNELDSQGIVQRKVWIATPDDRVRESHLELDGEEVALDEEFSNGCMFPGDGNCPDTSEVWNCRCSMKSHVVGFRRADGSISYIQGREPKETTHDKAIDKERERRR